MKLVCPNCGGTDIQYHYSTKTAMYWPHIFHDGILENNDPNITTSYYTCTKCRHKFYIEEQHGGIIECKDQGEEPLVPIVEGDLTGSSAPITYTPEYASISIGTIDSNNNPLRTKYQWELDIEELQKEVASIKDTLARLEKDLLRVETRTYKYLER